MKFLESPKLHTMHQKLLPKFSFYFAQQVILPYSSSHFSVMVRIITDLWFGIDRAMPQKCSSETGKQMVAEHNLDEMNKLIERFKLLKLSQEDREHLNRTITRSSVNHLKTSHKEKSQAQKNVSVSFPETFPPPQIPTIQIHVCIYM